MLNKENYVPWSSHLFRYAKSRPNEKLIYNSIINGPYVRRMIPEPGDAARAVLVLETFHEQTDDELTEAEIKQMEADDQAIQTILLGLPKDIYAAIDSYPTTAINMIAQLGMNMGQDRQMQLVRGNGKDCLDIQNLGVQNVGNQNGLIVVPRIANQNPNRNGNVVAARAEGNAIGNNEEGIQLQAEEFDLMAAITDLDEIKEVNAKCILMANLQRASTSGTQTDKALVYDSDGSAEVHLSDNCYNNKIFNMFTQNEQYIEILEPIPETHQVLQNDSNVISEASSVEQGGEIVEQHPATVEETHAYHESLFHNLAAEVEKSVYQEQCLTKKINALHLSSGKQITALNEEISNLNKQLSKEKSTVSSLQEEKKRLKSDFKIREDELLDKQIQLENKIKELDNILVKTGQSIQTMHMLSPKPDSFYHTEQKMALGYQNPFYLKQAQQKQQSLYNGKVLLEKHDPPTVYDSEETLELAQESRLKMKQLNKEIKPANYTKINHLSGVFVSQTAKSREELYFSNTSKTANVSKSISIPNEEFLDDTTPSVARKFLNEVKSTIVTLQRVVKQKMTLDIHNWSSSAHQEIHKIVKDEIFPIVNQVDARVQNFEIQFLKEAAKFVRDFQSLAKEADESLAKHKALELEIERLLRAVVSQDIMSIVQSNSVIDTSNLQTELERTKERFKICIIKKENEYAKLWNDWYKKCEECKYDKISYDKAYNDMQQKIERLQAQLGDLNSKKSNQSWENHLLLLDQNLYYVTPLPKSKVISKVGESNALSKPVTSNSTLSSRESTVVNNERVIALGIFRINPFKAPRVDNFVPNKHVKASVRTKPITISQPYVIIKKDVNSITNGFSLKNVESFTKTRRPQPRSNPKSDKVPFKSKSSFLLNKLEKIEENHKSLQCSDYLYHTSSECNNIKLAIRNEKFEVICATYKQCLITANHDECVLQYVNGMKSRKKNQSANVSKSANQKKHKAQVWKPKNIGSKERLALPKPSTPRSCLRWAPTGRMFDLKGKIIVTSESECQLDCSKGDNACTSNPQEPINKRFPSSTFSMTGCQNWFDTLLIPLLSKYKSKDKEDHGDNECDT
ncbi:hypothetical protein Tco_0716326 [Tanacetum coccineum]